jgi:hypothetical protein
MRSTMKQMARARNTKTHPQGWAWIQRGEHTLAGFNRRSDATGTQLHFGRLAVLNPRNRLQVWVEAAASMPVREADRIAERWAFAALSAFSHEWMPPTAYGFLRRMIRVCNGRAAVTLYGQATALRHIIP